MTNFFQNLWPTDPGDITPVQVITKLAENYPDCIDLLKLKEQAIQVLDDDKAEPLAKSYAIEFANYIKDRIKIEDTLFLERHSQGSERRI